jgi:hypothetical protein
MDGYPFEASRITFGTAFATVPSNASHALRHLLSIAETPTGNAAWLSHELDTTKFSQKSLPSRRNPPILLR